MNPIIILARILFAPLILKWPLGGGIIAVLLDNLDWHTKDLFGILPIGNYENIDKILDLWYLSFFAIVVLRFKNKLVSHVLIFLFVYRATGIILFEATNARILLFIFPNIFENFFFFYYILKKIIGREPQISINFLAILFGAITFFKMIEEYVIHVAKTPLPTPILVFYILGIAILCKFLLKKASKTH